jgi:hypothetical protein
VIEPTVGLMRAFKAIFNERPNSGMDKPTGLRWIPAGTGAGGGPATLR